MKRAQGRQAGEIVMCLRRVFLGGGHMEENLAQTPALSAFFCFVTREEMALNMYSVGYLRIRT